jgi:hypothetical protein
VHDTDFVDVNAKQQDPVQWERAQFRANAALQSMVGRLIQLRTSHAALQRNETDFFYFHPQFDANEAPCVFAYCRTGGLPAGSPGQVVVVANMGPAAFPSYFIPGWPWQNEPLTEIGYTATAPAVNAGGLTLSLDGFSARVFTT